MKILHVNGYATGGGIEQYLVQLFEELAQRGHQNFFLFGIDSHDTNSLQRTKLFHIKNITQICCKDLNKKLKLVQEIIDRYNPDMVYIHQVLNSKLIHLLATQRPSVRFVHGFKMMCPDGRKTLNTIKKVCSYPLGYTCQVNAYKFRCMPRNPLVGVPLIFRSKKIARLHKKYSHMVVASHFMKSILLYNGFEEKKVNVIPYFTYLPTIQDNAYVKDRPIIFALGRIVPEKGMHTLFHAMGKLDEKVQLVVAGDGSALDELKKLAKELGISERVSFCGWIDHQKLDTLYQQCSMVVIPSIWPEPFGIVGIEAMAYGKPTIAYDVGGISEWLKDGDSGFLVKPGDENELVEKINFILNNPAQVVEMEKFCKQLILDRFIPEAHIGILMRLFDKAMNSSPLAGQ